MRALAGSPDEVIVIEFFEDVLTLGLLIVLNRNMPLLELRFLRVVLSSDLLVLLADDIGLNPHVLLDLIFLVFLILLALYRLEVKICRFWCLSLSLRSWE